VRGEDFDELVDELPLHLRNRVLAALDRDPEYRDEDDIEFAKRVKVPWQKRLLWWTILPIPFTLSAALALIAIPLCVIPIIGVPLLVLASQPMGLMLIWRVQMAEQAAARSNSSGEI
jgi:hypothetical protein